MNPHFIFNSLNSIQKFIVRNDAESAHRYLSKFGSLVRTILHNSSRAFLPLADEIHSLELYLQLESLRLEHNFDYKLDIDPSIEVHTMMIPAMIIQPYVENAIWHGIMPLPHKGRLDLSFRLKGEALLCTIRDNGIGRKKSAELRKERQVQHQSKGMKITEDRLNILALTEDLASTININDIDEDGITGTVVQLILPVKYIFSPYENSESSNR
jgi:LytS/YehU family sensor histidine kinase